MFTFAIPQSLPQLDKKVSDSLKFLSLDGLYKAIFGQSRNNTYPQLTDHYFTGEYPVDLVDQQKNDKVAIRSGHGVGKTAFQSWLILWWMLTHYPCKIAITGNTQHQLQDVLWTELDKWYRQLPDGFKSQLDIKSDKIALHGAKDSYAVCRVSRRESPESLQGFHSENMLFICEEASGIPDIIFIKAGTKNPNRNTIYSIEETRQIFETNFFGTLNCLSALLPYLKKKKQLQLIIM
mgnify:CR=1 FL=1